MDKNSLAFLLYYDQYFKYKLIENCVHISKSEKLICCYAQIIWFLVCGLAGISN